MIRAKIGLAALLGSIVLGALVPSVSAAPMPLGEPTIVGTALFSVRADRSGGDAVLPVTFGGDQLIARDRASRVEIKIHRLVGRAPASLRIGTERTYNSVELRSSGRCTHNSFCVVVRHGQVAHIRLSADPERDTVSMTALVRDRGGCLVARSRAVRRQAAIPAIKRLTLLIPARTGIEATAQIIRL